MSAKRKKDNNQAFINKEASLKSKNKFSLLARLFVFCWPMIYLFNYIIPINGQYAAASNDFIVLYYRYKIYLLACLAKFKFPLWSPAEAAGFPFFTNPFAQAFYPLNLPLVLWYRISGGYNPYDHQIFAIIGISIFALGLYEWLRLINKNARAVILSAVIISVSFKMTELLRFPNAVHTAAWYPWILYAITKIFISKSLKGRIFAGILLVFFIICMCTGGYPYNVYYSQFLILPYILIFLIKPLRQSFLGIDSIELKPSVAVLSVSGILSGIICMPYLLAIKNLMAQVTDRAGRSFEYSTDIPFNYQDTIGSLVYPPASQTEGWYFFSITALLIILLYLFTKSSDEAPCDSPLSRRTIIKIFFVIWIAIISYISYGKNSYLFIFLWNYMPGFSSLRNWGRLNIILLPILAWLLTFALNYFENVISGSFSAQKKFWKENKAIITLILVYAVILGAQLYLYRNKICDLYWGEYLGRMPSDGKWFLYLGIAGFAVILSILIAAKKYALAAGNAFNTIFILLAAISVIEMWPIGTHTWTIKSIMQNYKINVDIDGTNQASFNYARMEGDAYRRYSISLQPSFSVGILPNWYFDRYVKFFQGKSDDLEAQRILLGVYGGQKVFFSEAIDYNSVRVYLKDALRFKNSGYPWLYTGDKLDWRMNAPVKGYVSFIDNWDSSWKAFVDGKETKIELLFGTFKSVAVEKGEHCIEFVYKPTLQTVLGIGKNDRTAK